MAANIYPYQPLNTPTETRVLVIKSGQYDDDIIASITHIDLANNPEYEALSYVWRNAISLETPRDPDMEVVVAVYDPTGEDTMTKRMPFRDLLLHPHCHNLYYEAGGERPPGEIICDDHRLPIGGELASALKRLRSADQPLIIWVDALCINQNDIAERNKHVRRMGEIYSKAKHVRIWLGEGTEKDEALNDTITGLAMKIQRVQMDWGDSFKARWAQQAERDRLGFPADEMIRGLNWEVVADFLRRAWFERVWVIQEITYAANATVHLGPSITFDWEFLTLIVQIIKDVRLDIPLRWKGQCKGLESIHLMKDLRLSTARFEQMQRISLLNTLEETRQSLCQVPSDKIYAVLTLTSDSGFIDVDYSVSDEDLYHQYAVKHIKDTNTLDTLHHCIYNPKPSVLKNLPGWVPDWTRPGKVVPWRIRKLDSHAGGTGPPQFRLTNNDKELWVAGRLVDTVTTIETMRAIPAMGDTSPSETRLDTQATFYRHLQAMALRTRAWMQNMMDIAFENKDPTEEQTEALWRTFMCNRTVANVVPDERYHDAFYTWMTATLRGRTVDQALEDEKGEEEQLLPYPTAGLTLGISEDIYHTLHTAFSRWCYNRRFYVSEAGRYGWAVDGCQEGDVICVLDGVDYPLMLRRQLGDEESFSIVGDCYLHGVMDGEALMGRFEEREFHFR